MDLVTPLFDVGHVALRLGSYSVSWLELVSTALYLGSVVLAIRPHVMTWPLGIVANVLLFALFFQIQLYSDVLLQTYYIAVSAWGWWLWHHGDRYGPVKLGRLEAARLATVIAVACVAIVILGTVSGRVHLWLPALFPRAASFAYADATTTVLSVVATVLLARKKVESWILWLVVDAVCVYLYFAKGVLLMAAEYALFFIMAAAGLVRWRRILAVEAEREARVVNA